MYLQNSKS